MSALPVPIRDPRSLFDLDERLIELMDQLEESTADGAEPSADLVQKINDYIEAFRTKVDRMYASDQLIWSALAGCGGLGAWAMNQ